MKETRNASGRRAEGNAELEVPAGGRARSRLCARGRPTIAAACGLGISALRVGAWPRGRSVAARDAGRGFGSLRESEDASGIRAGPRVPDPRGPEWLSAVTFYIAQRIVFDPGSRASARAVGLGRDRVRLSRCDRGSRSRAIDGGPP